MKFFVFNSSNMKKINSARANYLFNTFFSSSFEMNICSMIRRLFISEPSLFEHVTCNNCTHYSSITFPLITLNNILFANDFSNLERAIIENYPEKLACSRCKNDVPCKREYGHHMFIEVNITTMNNTNRYILFDQIINYSSIFSI